MKKNVDHNEKNIFFDPRPLTDKEKKLISDFIKKDKVQRKKSKNEKLHSL